MKNNGKATVQKLYDEIIPLIKGISEHTVKIEDIEDDIGDIKKDMKCKISIKAFASWLTTVSIVVGIIITILALRG